MNKVWVQGDASAIGATVVVDGKRAGTLKPDVMERAWVRGTEDNYGVRRCYAPGDTIAAAGDTMALAEVWMARGDRAVVIISMDHDTLSGPMLSTSSAWIEVSFKCRVLEQIE